MDAKISKRLVLSSAGSVILSLVHEEEKVALVFNKVDEEVKKIPGDSLKRSLIRHDSDKLTKTIIKILSL